MKYIAMENSSSIYHLNTYKQAIRPYYYIIDVGYVWKNKD